MHRRTAKKEASRRGKSVSQIVGEFFDSLASSRREEPELPPITTSLVGILKGRGVSESDYRRHLEGEVLVRVLVDTNVVLDVLLARQPFLGASAEVFGLVEHSRIDGFLCATTITTIDYLLTQAMSRPTARQALRKLLELFDIAPVNRAVLEEALKSKLADFEDAVLDQAGRLAGAEVVVTRNQQDFRHAALKVLGPDELLASLPG